MILQRSQNLSNGMKKQQDTMGVDYRNSGGGRNDETNHYLKHLLVN